MLLVLFIVVALALLGIFGFVILASTSRKQKQAEANADRILDDAFNGAPDVTFTLNATTLKYETVLAGAKSRGYTLAHQADNQYGPRTLMFEKAQTA